MKLENENIGEMSEVLNKTEFGVAADSDTKPLNFSEQHDAAQAAEVELKKLIDNTDINNLPEVTQKKISFWKKFIGTKEEKMEIAKIEFEAKIPKILANAEKNKHGGVVNTYNKMVSEGNPEAENYLKAYDHTGNVPRWDEKEKRWAGSAFHSN